ncbi:MAG: PIN domain-containing protein [Candidatus Woesearchaeota archaeon]
MRKAAIQEEEYDLLLGSIMSNISLLNLDKHKAAIDEATIVMSKRDPTDIIFLAAALCLENCLIWSNDLDLKAQDKIKVINTQELVILLSK